MQSQMPMDNDRSNLVYGFETLRELQAALWTQFNEGATLDALADHYKMSRSKTLEHISVHRRRIERIKAQVAEDDLRGDHE